MGANAVSIGLAHYAYLVGVIAVIVAMVLRANVVVPAIIGTFVVAFAYSGSVITGVTAIFNGSLVAAKELFNIFLVIALMTSLLNALRSVGADLLMVKPFARIMTNGHVAFAVLAVVTYVISLFFWPTPATPIIAATLLPAAILAGLSPMGAAIAIAIAGQGMALSSDYIIRVAPGISAKAAGIPEAAAMVADRALVLSLITGAVALALGYLAIRRSILAPDPAHLVHWQSGATLTDRFAAPAGKTGTFDKPAIAAGMAAKAEAEDPPSLATVTGGGVAAIAVPSDRWSALLATITPIAFLLVVACMAAPKFISGNPELKGGDAAALVGGTAAVMMLIATFAADSRSALNTVAEHVIDGLVFAFKAMGAVLPIAGFFFIGGDETSAGILGLPAGAKAPALLFELVQAIQGAIPQNSFLMVFGLLIVGMITGIDGSGFSGLPLTGALSGALGPAVGMDPATLAAVGQMGAVWTGGGTLVAWSSLIAVTGFARVPVLEAARILFLPVIAGLVVSTIAAVLLW